MTVKCATITWTILFPDNDPPELSDGYVPFGLCHYTSDGPGIGAYAITSVEDVDPDKLSDLLVSMGNDGTFFDPFDDPVTDFIDKAAAGFLSDDVRASEGYYSS